MTRKFSGLAVLVSAVIATVGPGASHAHTAGVVLTYGREGTFPDGRTYRALLGPNQGVPVVHPDCIPPCYYTAVINHSGWVQNTVHAYNLFWHPSGSYSGYDSWMSSCPATVKRT